MLVTDRGSERVFMVGYPVSYEILDSLHINEIKLDIDIYVNNHMSKSRRIFGVTRSMIRASGILLENAEYIHSIGYNMVILAEKHIDGRYIGGPLVDLIYFFYDAKSGSYVRFDPDTHSMARAVVHSLQNFVTGTLGDPEDIAKEAELHALLKKKLRKKVGSYARGT